MIEYYTVFRWGFDNEPDKDIGLLSYDPDTNTYAMYIDRSLINRYELPIVLYGLDQSDTPTDRSIKLWIDSKTTPSDRIGIQYTLADLNLSEYNGWEILKAARGINPGIDHLGFYRTDKPNKDWISHLNQ